MDITMPESFPLDEFRAFGLAADKFFPAHGSNEHMLDPLQRINHFDWSWQAVRYRYRSCAQINDEFKAVVNDAPGWMKAGWGDEETTYKVERCIYMFFMSGLSVFDSFAFCLYYFGEALNPSAFPLVTTPRDITRAKSAKAFAAAFPQASITQALTNLSCDSRFSVLSEVRNLVGHRVSGRRSVSGASEMNEDGTFTELWHKDNWHIPGISGELTFDENLLQRQFDHITDILKPLVTAAREFAEVQQATKIPPC